jgi:hypothetical protein
MLAVLAFVVLLSATPALAATSQADDLVRFTIENKADRGITVRLYAQDGSGQAYYVHVEAKTTKSLTPIRGMYDYRLTSCGIMLFGVLDLTKASTTWVNPNCGLKSGANSKETNTQDVGQILKLVKVTLENETGTQLMIWLHGPFDYVFIIPKDGEKTVSIPKGFYTWGHFACDGIYQTGNLYADFYKTKVIVCK